VTVLTTPSCVCAPPTPPVTVFAKFITVEFAPDDVAVLRAALEKKP